MVFQCFPAEEVNAARIALGLSPIHENNLFPTTELKATISVAAVNHNDVMADLVEIGRIQGFIGEKEYPLESTRLDVVWRRVERSVPTYVFEVQVGGDIYHALSKLKHAFDLWNSHVFLIASNSERAKFNELIAGTFHEIANRIHFIEIGLIAELLGKKRDYKRMEQALGILQR